MLYYNLKVGHVIVACVLLAACAWSCLPVYRAWNNAFWWKWVSHLNSSFRRMLFVIPLGVAQGILGMATLSVEPVKASTNQIAGLLVSFLALAFLWLIGMGLVKYVALAVRQGRHVPVKKIQRFYQVWISLLLGIFIGMLYLMVNFVHYRGVHF